MTKQHRDDRGAAMLEFAIILPILLMLVMGIIEFGRAYNTQVSIQAAAREGARELALGNNSNVETTVRNAAPTIEIDSISPDVDGSATKSCKDADAKVASVTVTESFSFGIPFVPLGTKTLEATGVMRCGL